MLGFEPQMRHFDTASPAMATGPAEIEIVDAPEHQTLLFAAMRDENKCLASEAAAYRQAMKASRTLLSCKDK